MLQHPRLAAADLGRLRRFARYWDLLGNSGNFVETLPLLWSDESPFWTLWRLTDWLYERLGRFVGIPLLKLTELVFEFATSQLGCNLDELAPTMLRDYQRGGRSDTPPSLRDGVIARCSESSPTEVGLKDASATIATLASSLMSGIASVRDRSWHHQLSAMPSPIPRESSDAGPAGPSCAGPRYAIRWLRESGGAHLAESRAAAMQPGRSGT